jgi:membrane protein DedA with SNARE-associated domain
VGQKIDSRFDEIEAAVERERELAAKDLPWAATLYRWVLDHLPKSRRGRMIVAIIVGVLVLIPSVGLLVVTFVVPDFTKDLEALGYSGIFLANLASTATVFIPVPGLTAASQTLIITQGKHLNPVFVGLLGGTGMALGEITAYAAGAAGSEAVEEGRLQAPKVVRRPVERIVHWVDWLMDHYGFATLLVLSAIPNPFFEVAGLSAGASRMNFWRFMVAVLIGKNIRGLLLAFVSVPYLT